jgi:2-amino-4-hydroxy-6-hydroxymethyldihydropteridine diphosphokinase
VKVELRDDLTIFFQAPYPSLNKKKSSKKHTATLGIGGNIGNVRKRFKKLYNYLQQSRQVDLIEASPILKNPAFGYTNQDDYYNALLIIKTNLPPHALLKYILYVEKRFKRIRAFKNSPRTLDIDMIFYDKISISSKYLTLPHPHFHERESVLIPLNLIKNQVYI